MKKNLSIPYIIYNNVTYHVNRHNINDYKYMKNKATCYYCNSLLTYTKCYKRKKNNNSKTLVTAHFKHKHKCKMMKLISNNYDHYIDKFYKDMRILLKHNMNNMKNINYEHYDSIININQQQLPLIISTKYF